jgi:hypothetical protein
MQQYRFATFFLRLLNLWKNKKINNNNKYSNLRTRIRHSIVSESTGMGVHLNVSIVRYAYDTFYILTY